MIQPTEFKPSFSPTEMETRYAGMKFERWVLPICDFQLDYDALADSDGYWFDDYASHLLDTHDYDDEELCNEMWSLVRYYGGGGEEFGKWYENRSQDSVDCPEYDEWVKEYWGEKARMELAKPEQWGDYPFGIPEEEPEEEWTDPLDEEDAWRLENPMECEDCGDKGNAIAKKVEGKWKIKCPDCWSKEEEPKCWTCDEKPATHSVYRDALNENELTCDGCYSEEYPEEEQFYDEENDEIISYEEWKKDQEDDESIIQYRKEIEEGCPEGYKTVWNSHGFRYEEEEPSEIFTNKMISELTEEELEKEASPYMRLLGLEDEPHINEEDYDKWICDEKENCTGTRHCKGCY